MTGAQLLKELYYIVLFIIEGNDSPIAVYMKEKVKLKDLVAELKAEGTEQFLVLHEGTRHYMKKVKGEWMYAKVKKHPYLKSEFIRHHLQSLQEYREGRLWDSYVGPSCGDCGECLECLGESAYDEKHKVSIGLEV